MVKQLRNVLAWLDKNRIPVVKYFLTFCQKKIRRSFRRLQPLHSLHLQMDITRNSSD